MRSTNRYSARIASAGLLALLILTPFSSAYASASVPNQDGDDVRKKYEELARLAAELEADLKACEDGRETLERRVRAAKREIANLQKALDEEDVQEPATDRKVENLQKEVENLGKEIAIKDQLVSDLKTELDRVRRERDALRGTPWLKIAIAALIGAGLALAIKED